MKVFSSHFAGVGNTLVCEALMSMFYTLMLHILGWLDPSPAVVEPTWHLSQDI